MAAKPFSIGDAIRLAALRSVFVKDDEYELRRIYRWYSKTFATPLHEVPDLDLVHVLRTYWETIYENLPIDKRWEERCELLKTEEQRNAEIAQEELEEIDRFQFAKEIEQEERERKIIEAARREKAKAEKDKMLQGSVERTLFEAAIDKTSKPTPIKADESPIPLPTELPPDIHFEFSDFEPDTGLSDEELAAMDVMNPPDK